MSVLKTAPVITVDSTVVCTGNQISSALEDGAVLLDLESGVYYGLNAVGFQIWNLMKSPIRIGHLLSCLLEDYEVDPQVCEQEVLALAHSLSSEGLIQVVTAPVER
ncbi:MAG: PqqD family peptide modification chaperone [Thermostichus sp. BF3_bins_97]